MAVHGTSFCVWTDCLWKRELMLMNSSSQTIGKCVIFIIIISSCISIIVVVKEPISVA